MSKEGRRGVLLTNDGAFETIKLKRTADVDVGEAILENDLSRPLPFYMKIWLPTLAACFSIICILLFINGMIKNKAVAAYVSLDINPSIEVSVNRKLHVLSVKPLNDDARAVLHDPKQYFKMPLETFVLKMASKLAHKGYFKDRPEVLITTALTNHISKNNREDFAKQIDQAVDRLSNQETFQKNLGHCEVRPTTLKMHNKAKKRGLSTGKYLVYLDASKYKKDLTIDQAKKLSVKDMEAYTQPNTDSSSNYINHSIQTRSVTDKESRSENGKTSPSEVHITNQNDQSEGTRTSAYKQIKPAEEQKNRSNNSDRHGEERAHSSAKTKQQQTKRTEDLQTISHADSPSDREKVQNNKADRPSAENQD